MTQRVNYVLLILIASGVNGCARHRAEKCCPTDARALYCAPGEEAVRRCPCGPDHVFHGHKPTSWRVWPDDWAFYQVDRYGYATNINPPCELPEVLPEAPPEVISLPRELFDAPSGPSPESQPVESESIGPAATTTRDQPRGATILCSADQETTRPPNFANAKTSKISKARKSRAYASGLAIPLMPAVFVR